MQKSWSDQDFCTTCTSKMAYFLLGCGFDWSSMWGLAYQRRLLSTMEVAASCYCFTTSCLLLLLCCTDYGDGLTDNDLHEGTDWQRTPGNHIKPQLLNASTCFYERSTHRGGPVYRFMKECNIWEREMMDTLLQLSKQQPHSRGFGGSRLLIRHLLLIT